MKPLLYHDIDGVLFGEYGARKAHQLRPGVNDWFHWVLARYQLVFLTSWKQHELFNLLDTLYLPDTIEHSRFLHWKYAARPIPFKWDAILEDQQKHPHPFLWIDDEAHVFPEPAEQSQYFGGIPFVRVNPTGPNELPNLIQRLNARTKKLEEMISQHQSRNSVLQTFQ